MVNICQQSILERSGQIGPTTLSAEGGNTYDTKIHRQRKEQETSRNRGTGRERTQEETLDPGLEIDQKQQKESRNGLKLGHEKFANNVKPQQEPYGFKMCK